MGLVPEQRRPLLSVTQFPRLLWRLCQLVAMTCSRIMVVRFFVRVRVIRHQAEGIQVGCDSFQHADHPRPVESNRLRLEIFIGPKIHNHVFATLQSLQPISAASQ